MAYINTDIIQKDNTYAIIVEGNEIILENDEYDTKNSNFVLRSKGLERIRNSCGFIISAPELLHSEGDYVYIVQVSCTNSTGETEVGVGESNARNLDDTGKKNPFKTAYSRAVSDSIMTMLGIKYKQPANLIAEKRKQEGQHKENPNIEKPIFEPLRKRMSELKSTNSIPTWWKNSMIYEDTGDLSLDPAKRCYTSGQMKGIVIAEAHKQNPSQTEWYASKSATSKNAEFNKDVISARRLLLGLTGTLPGNASQQATPAAIANSGASNSALEAKIAELKSQGQLPTWWKDTMLGEDNGDSSLNPTVRTYSTGKFKGRTISEGHAENPDHTVWYASKSATSTKEEFNKDVISARRFLLGLI